MTFWKWSKTAAANATADGSVNWAEGMAPSAVNDSARAMMAAAAKYRDDMAGALATGGTAAAYTLSTHQTFDSLASMNGHQVAFVMNATNTGPCTLNVDGLGAKPLRSTVGGDLGPGVLIANTPYAATYFNSTGEWILHGFYGNPYNIPLGGMLDYTGATAPNSAFVLPYGQAISRTTYASYFALVGTTYGTGDGSSTFNVADLRGRFVAGKDDMGGGAASRLSGAVALGATQGAESKTVTQANLPNVTLTGSPGQPSQSLNHGGYHAIPPSASPSSFVIQSGNSTFASNAFQQIPDIVVTFPNYSVPLGGAGTAMNIVPPTICLNKILRIL